MTRFQVVSSWIAGVLLLSTLSTAQTLVSSGSGVHIYFRTSWTTPYIHYSTGNSVWTAVPGVAMTASSNTQFPKAAGWFQFDLASATTLEFVFNNGNGVWDNNNNVNYFVKTAGTYQLTSLVSPPAATTAPATTATPTGVHIYYRTSWTTPYIHYLTTNSNWTVSPGVRMTASSNTQFPKASGWFQYDLAGAKSLEFVFNNGNGMWDNNNNADYFVTAAGTYQYTSLVSAPTTAPTTTATPKGNVKGVFVHYMPGGMRVEEAAKDVQDAKKMGVDAFIINVSDVVASWSLDCVAYLFTAAEAAGFKLFFSWDMSWLANPGVPVALMAKYASSSAYYKYNNQPVSTTFIGGAMANSAWQTQYLDVLAAKGIATYFIPDFDDVDPGANFFDKFPAADGTLCWDCAWAPASTVAGQAVQVSTSLDQVYIDDAKASGKTYMMAVSSHQYKHMDKSNNWFRAGSANLGRRFEQALKAQPDFIEIITWNDAGEGHYIGNVWQWSLDSSPAIQKYTYGYPHAGFQDAYIPFVAGIKAGATTLAALAPQNGRQVQGAMWYHPLLNSGDCSADSLGKPGGYQAALDDVSVVATFANSGGKVTVYSGGSQIGSFTAAKGLNYWSVLGLKTGQVRVDVAAADGSLLSSTTGNVTVASQMSLCNYNYAVFSL